MGREQTILSERMVKPGGFMIFNPGFTIIEVVYASAIADDEAMIRYALKSIIKSLNMVCVGEATNGLEAVALYAKEKPDIMFLDINMPVKNGDEALKDICAKFPDANVVMLTSVAETETVKKCVQDGAINYILKTNPLDKIKLMVEEIVKNI